MLRPEARWQGGAERRWGGPGADVERTWVGRGRADYGPFHLMRTPHWRELHVINREVKGFNQLMCVCKCWPEATPNAWCRSGTHLREFTMDLWCLRRYLVDRSHCPMTSGARPLRARRGWGGVQRQASC